MITLEGLLIENEVDDEIPDKSVKDIVKYLTAFLSASEVKRKGDVYYTTYVPQQGEGWYFNQLISQGFKSLKKGSQRRYVKGNVVVDLFLDDFPEVTIAVSSSGVTTNPDPEKEKDSSEEFSWKRGYLINKNILSLSENGTSYYIAYRTPRNSRVSDPLSYVPVPKYFIVDESSNKVTIDANKFDRLLKDKGVYWDLKDILGFYQEVKF